MRKRPLILGLTGGIGMGKSTLAAQLAAMGAKICNADAIVHRLMGKGGAAVQEIGNAFPGVVEGGAVNRRALGDIVFHDKTKLKTLESILHPLVVAAENAFIEKEWRKGARLVVVDIPLLYETGAESRCHKVIVAAAPPFLQRQRVMKRSGMTEATFRRIRESQMPERDKRKRADAVVLTGLGRGVSFRQLQELINLWARSSLRAEGEAIQSLRAFGPWGGTGLPRCARNDVIGR